MGAPHHLTSMEADIRALSPAEAYPHLRAFRNAESQAHPDLLSRICILARSLLIHFALKLKNPCSAGQCCPTIALCITNNKDLNISYTMLWSLHPQRRIWAKTVRKHGVLEKANSGPVASRRRQVPRVRGTEHSKAINVKTLICSSIDLPSAHSFHLPFTASLPFLQIKANLILIPSLTAYLCEQVSFNSCIYKSPI